MKEWRDDMKKIYRTYADLEYTNTVTNLKCPYCNYEFQETDMDECGRTYEIECEECEKVFEMSFDAD